MKTKFFAVVITVALLLSIALVGPGATPVRAANTLYVGAGGYSTIQAAIDAAADGDTIVVAAGTYSGTTNGELFPIRVNKQVMLLGAQANVDPRPSRGGRTGDETIVNGEETSEHVLQIMTSGVEINGFTITGGTGDMVWDEGFGSSNKLQGLLFRYNILYDLVAPGDEGIQIVNSDSVIIEYNYAHDLFQDAFNICHSSNGVIRYNEACDSATVNAAIYCYMTTNTDIIGNLVYNVDAGDNQHGNGIQMGDWDDGVMSTGGVVRDNVVHNIAQDGINVEEMIGVTVENNTVYSADSQDGAIYIRNVQDSTFTNNRVYNNDAIGVLIKSSSGITVSGNSICNNADTNDTNYPGTAGIWIVADSDASTIGIHSNNIHGNAEYGVINLDTLHTASATGNWWGNASGPTHSGNPGGSGDAVSDYVDYASWQTGPFAMTWYVAAGESIQQVVDAAHPGDTVVVAAGTYAGKVTVNKALTLNGANVGISAGATPGTRGAESVIQGGVQIQANNVVLDGFKIDGPAASGQKDGIYIVGSTSGLTIANNVLAGNDNSGTGPFAIEFAMYTSAIAVRNNDIGNWRSTYINPTNPSSNLLFEGNNFHNNYVGIGSDGLNDVNIQFNKFTSNSIEGFGSSAVGSNVQAHNNDFVGNGAGINQYGGQTIDATNNWWGDNSGPYNATYNSNGLGDDVTGNVSFIPWTGMPSPTVSSVSPNQGLPNDHLIGVVISGTYFNGATGVSFDAGITASNLAVNSSGTQITVDLSIALDAIPGSRDVSVTTPATPGTGVLPDGFTVNSPNGPPVAADDAYSVDYGITLTVAAPGVLGNDSDPESDPLTAVLLSGVTNGALTLNSDGSFVYAPNGGFQTTDTFTYRAFDGLGYSNSATVTITVNPDTLRPVAADDAYSVDIGTTVTIAAPGVLGNDSDPQGDPLTAELVSDVSYGTLTLNSNGSFIYVPDPGFQGTDTFTYRAFDGLHYSNPATVYVTERPPKTPSLISPDNGAIVTGTFVTFQWSALAGAVNYKLVVSTKNSITDAAYFKCNKMVGNVATYTDTAYPAQGTKYYWWVLAYAADGSYSPLSEVVANGRWFTNMPSVATPALVSPANSASVAGTSVSFQWGTVTGAVDYKLLVSTKSNIMDATGYKFNTKVGNVTTYTDTGYLANGTKYYWWVSAFAADGTYSLFSEVVANGRWFSSMPTVGTPSLVSPANGASVTGTSVNFEWGAATNAVDYKLLVSTSSDIMNTAAYKFNAKVGNVTTYTNTGYLANGTKYYWWVFGYAADGTFSLFSQVVANGRWFTNVPSVGTPTLISPANGAAVIGTSVSFSWSAPAGAVSYKLTVSTKSDIMNTAAYKFNTNVGNVTTYTDTGYLGNGTNYFWWVTAYAADGTWSTFSQVVANGRWFTSMPSVGTPALASPATGAALTGTSVSYEWSAPAGAVNYKLTVSTKSDIMNTAAYKFNNTVGNVTAYTDNTTGYLCNGTKYYWWVTAYAADGTYSLFSQVAANGRWFTSMPSIGTPTLVSPANGASVSGTSVSFSWSAPAGAVDYKLVVSTSSDIMNTAAYKFNTKVGNVTTYTDTGYLANGKKYYWWVFAYAADGTYSLFSEAVANGRWFTSVS